MEIGSLDENLVIKTKGKIKIQYGRTLIDLLSPDGNLNTSLLGRIDALEKRLKKLEEG